MITRIELTNFMSHAHTVIEPAAGLTVLVGPNNCGKSAVVAALQILCHNDNSTYVLRHGAKECSVKVTTADAHTVEWRRKNSPSYVVDGQLFDRLRGAGLPEELHKALCLPHVDAGGEGEFDVHFGSQKSPIFLLDRSPATAARFFASSSDAIRLLQMRQRHKEKLAQRQRDKIRLEAESKQLNAELEALRPALDLDRRLKAAELLHAELLRLAGWLSQAQRDQTALGGQLQAVAQCQAQSLALAPLTPPPVLEPTEPLVKLATAIEQARHDEEHVRAHMRSLAALPSPPPLHDEVALAATSQRLVTLGAAVERGNQQGQRLAPLDRPPTLADTDRLEQLIQRLDTAGSAALASRARSQSLAAVALPPAPADVAPLADWLARHELALSTAAQCRTELKAAQQELAAAEEALRELAAKTEQCPVCGSPLDADRLLSRAAAGVGGHVHG